MAEKPETARFHGGLNLQDRIRVRSTELLSDNWARLTKTTFDYRRNDGVWETQTRETYD